MNGLKVGSMLEIYYVFHKRYMSNMLTPLD